MNIKNLILSSVFLAIPSNAYSLSDETTKTIQEQKDLVEHFISWGTFLCKLSRKNHFINKSNYHLFGLSEESSEESSKKYYFYKKSEVNPRDTIDINKCLKVNKPVEKIEEGEIFWYKYWREIKVIEIWPKGAYIFENPSYVEQRNTRRPKEFIVWDSIPWWWLDYSKINRLNYSEDSNSKKQESELKSLQEEIWEETISE